MFRRTLTLAQGTLELPRFGGHLTLGISPARSWLILSDSFPEVLAKLGPAGGRPAVLKDGLEESNLSPRDVLPRVEVFGQHEISELTKSREKLTRLPSLVRRNGAVA